MCYPFQTKSNRQFLMQLYIPMLIYFLNICLDTILCAWGCVCYFVCEPITCRQLFCLYMIHNKRGFLFSWHDCWFCIFSRCVHAVSVDTVLVRLLLTLTAWTLVWLMAVVWLIGPVRVLHLELNDIIVSRLFRLPAAHCTTYKAGLCICCKIK